MGRVVVGNNVDVKSGWRLLVNLLEEVEPFDVGLGWGIALKDFPRGVVEDGEKSCRAMARIVMRDCLDVPDSQRKPRPSPLQCLTLPSSHRSRTRSPFDTGLHHPRTWRDNSNHSKS